MTVVFNGTTTDRMRKTKEALEELNGTGQFKYRLIFENLREGILSGEFRQGTRLPSENALVRRFNVSRMTVVKAIKELQQMGLVVRRVGSGSYVANRNESRGRLFGLLIPELGQTEIFEPICKGMANVPEANHSLLWGNSLGPNQSKEEGAEELCRQYIDQKVSGVFFAPLEHCPSMELVNRRITTALDRAKIPVVLLDRCICPYPARSKFDLVGIDNRRTAYEAVEHLYQSGARRIAFIAKRFCAPTVDARIAGYREALINLGLSHEGELVFHCDPEDETQIRPLFDRGRPDAFLCANDMTAANLMRTLVNMGINIPTEVRLVGIDDVKYANLLPIPLTTQHQPCLDIGRIAMATMTDRIEMPDLPTRDISLGCHLIIRKSSGLQRVA